MIYCKEDIEIYCKEDIEVYGKHGARHECSIAFILARQRGSSSSHPTPLLQSILSWLKHALLPSSSHHRKVKERR
jgi:hypothetical protein